MIGDQRRWFRCSVPEGQSQALLRIGKKDTLVRVVNASSGGYTLAYPGPLNVEVDDLRPLKTLAGWGEIRVIHVATTEAGETVLGVERVRDLPDTYGRSWLDPIGGRFGAFCLALALLAGVLVGITQLGGGFSFLSGSAATAQP